MEKLIYIVKELWIAFSMPVAILLIIILTNIFLKRKKKDSRLFVKIHKIFKVILLILFICFFVIETAIISYSKHNEEKDDYIIVLGAGLDNGRTPNLILSERLDAAIRIEEENNAAYIVLSGGQGADEYISEAKSMSEYLQKRGIDKDKIILEDQSKNTNENIKFSKEKIEEHSQKSISEVTVKIVTTDYHAFRSNILAKKHGYINYDNYSSSTVWYFIPSTYIREVFGVIKSIVFDS